MAAAARWLLLVAVLALGLSACSPEARRVWGEGKETGADPNNWPRDGVVRMHPEEEPPERIYFETPREPTGPGQDAAG